jgi:hypothetical protein
MEKTMHDMILRNANGIEIRQRADNYFDATAMCRAYGKAFADYNRLKETGEFLKALSVDMGIPISNLIVTIIGRPATSQGTWVHERVAIDLARWLSPQFAVIVNGWVHDMLQGRPINAAGALIIDPFAIGDLVRKIMREENGQLRDLIREEIEQGVKAHVPIPRAEFTPATRRLILGEYLRQNPHGLDPTRWVRIFGDDRELIKGVGELHHMNGNWRTGFRDGFPVTVEIHRKLTADRERKGDEWRRIINAHKHFLDIHDASQVTLIDMLGRKTA